MKNTSLISAFQIVVSDYMIGRGHSYRTVWSSVTSGSKNNDSGLFFNGERKSTKVITKLNQASEQSSKTTSVHF